MSGNIYRSPSSKSAVRRVTRRGHRACAAAIPANSSLLLPTSPLFLHRLVRAIRTALTSGEVYYCHADRVAAVRFHRGCIQFKSRVGKFTSHYWHHASKPEGFTDSSGHAICASRELPRKRGGADA